MNSFLMHGAVVELFTDNLQRKVPLGTVVRSCRELLGNSMPRYGERSGLRAGSLAMSADVARLECLNRLGGWWVDTDVICLKPFSSIDDGVKYAWEDTSDPRNYVANVAVLRLPRGSSIARALLRRTYYPWFGSPWEPFVLRLRHFKWLFPSTIRDPFNIPWGWSAGPEALTSAIKYFGLTESALESEAFYPIHPSKWETLLELSDSEFQALAQRSFAVHLWAENFRQAGLDRNSKIQEAPWAIRYLHDFTPR